MHMPCDLQQAQKASSFSSCRYCCLTASPATPCNSAAAVAVEATRSCMPNDMLSHALGCCIVLLYCDAWTSDAAIHLHALLSPTRLRRLSFGPQKHAHSLEHLIYVACVQVHRAFAESERCRGSERWARECQWLHTFLPVGLTVGRYGRVVYQ